jgi:hypothetical protein
METYSTLIWKIIGAVAVLWVAQKLLSFFNNTQPVTSNQSTNTVAKPVTTSNQQAETPVKSIQANKVISNNTPTKVATTEKKEVFLKDSKDRERELDKRKKALTEKARNNMVNSMMGESNQSQQNNIVNNQTILTPVITSPVRTSPIVSSPNVTSPKISSPAIGELYNPVPLEQQLINSNLSKSNPSPLVNRTPVEEKKPVKTLSQSHSPNRVRKEKPAEEGLCLQTGEIKTIPAKISVEEDRETKRRRAIEAFELNKNKNL